VTCKECQELITPAVDQCLGEQERTEFSGHLAQCASCRREYELERRTKALVQHRAPMVATPVELSRAVRAMVRREAEAGGDRQESLWRRLVPRSVAHPALAAAVVLAALIVLWPSSEETPSPVSEASVAGADIVGEGFANFERLLSGAIRPQLETSEPERVRTFFSGRTTFPVLVPLTRQCTLIGAVFNEYGGVPLAHTVYRHNDQILYVYQTCWETVQRGSPLVLPEKVREAMQEKGMYTETRDDGSTIAVWTDGRTLCAAVAHMDRDGLLACLDLEGAAGPGAY
jgi:anti-sigma factor RsiW